MDNLNNAYHQVKFGSQTYKLNDFEHGDFETGVIFERVAADSRTEFDRCLASFCMRHSELLATPGYFLELGGKDSTGFYTFIVVFTGTFKECDRLEARGALNRVCGNTDWPQLQEQKKVLVEIQEFLGEDSEVSHMTEAIEGILNWIDCIQDFAVDEAGLNENKVFPGLGLEYHEKEDYVLIDEEGEVLGVVTSGKDMLSRITEAIRGALNHPEDLELIPDGGNILVKYAYDNGPTEGELRELEISLTSTTIY